MAFLDFLHTLYIWLLNGVMLFVSLLCIKYKCIFVCFILIFVEHPYIFVPIFLLSILSCQSFRRQNILYFYGKGTLIIRPE